MSSDSLTTTQAAARLNCSRSHIRNLIRAGTLPAYRVGRCYRVSLEAVQRLTVTAANGARL